MSTGPTMRGAGASFPSGTDQSDEASVIDRSSVFDGVLRTSRNLRIEGQAKGEIYCDGTVHVEEGAEVDARIVAMNVSVAGNLSGEITCRGRLQILSGGHVSARVATASLAIEEGAIYEGELRMSNIEGELAQNGNAPAVQVATGTTGGGQSVGVGANQAQSGQRAGARRGGGRNNHEDGSRAEGRPGADDPEGGR